MRTEKEIKNAFERALQREEECREGEHEGAADAYRNIANGLGWALGEYDDDPSE